MIIRLYIESKKFICRLDHLIKFDNLRGKHMNKDLDLDIMITSSLSTPTILT